MTDARLSISFAGPMVSLQDAGRTGALRFGVSPSGPMDRVAFAAAHAALGQPTGTAIEVSLGGISLTTDQPMTLAITGGAFEVDVDGTRSSAWQVLTLEAGQRLTVRAGATGSWAYLAFAGTLHATPWLGSTATHTPSGFGGGLVRGGDVLTVTGAEVRNTRTGALPLPDMSPAAPIRVTLGPQDHHFDADAVPTLLSQPFRVGAAYDRMGMRLDGPALMPKAALSIPSEPILRGAVQVSGDGIPTVLLADHQSTGGYPKIANVISPDTDALAQRRTGDTLRFKMVTPAEALGIARDHAERLRAYLASLDAPRGSLADRLMRENLIHGTPFEDENDP